MKLKFLIVFLLILATRIAYAETYFIPKTFLVLPQESVVKIKWILSPEQKNKQEVTPADKIQFFIDHKNEPVVVYDNKLLFNPLTGYMVKFKQPVKDVICLDNGVLLFSDGKNLGFLEIKKDDGIIPSGLIKAISRLPLPESKLFKGDDTVYAAGFNKKTKKYEVYLFNNSKTLFQKIASFKEPINALTGKGEHFFIASGKLIEEYRNGKLSVLYEHPRQEIKEIFYNEKAGLIYKTSNGAGLVKNNAALEFLQTEKPILFLKNTSLYVFFSSASGVLEIMNIDDLKNYSFKIEKVIDIKQTFQEELP
ncbi:hypothetical protein [Thermodesulfovibrio sp. TK110]